jgi:hypothetical protein
MSAAIRARLAVAQDLRDLAEDVRDETGAKIRERFAVLVGRVSDLEGALLIARNRVQSLEARVAALEAAHG